MFDFLKNYDYLFLPYLTQIIRLILIPFTSLGVVYIFGRLLYLCKSDRSKNTLAFISILFISFITGKGFGTDSLVINFNYIFNTFIYTTLSVIIYVTVCWRLYDRIDALLDKKIGTDEKETAKREAEEKQRIDDEKDRILKEKKKTTAALRKANKEKKLLEEANKKLEASKKRLTSKKK